MEVLDARKAKLGDDHPHTLITKNNLGVLYFDQGKYKAAERLMRETVEAERRKFGLASPETQMDMRNLCECYVRMKKPGPAEPLLRELAEFFKQNAGAASPQYAAELHELGMNLVAQKKLVEAQTVLGECLSIRREKEPDMWTSFCTEWALGFALLGQKRYSEAEPLILRPMRAWRGATIRFPRRAGPCLLCSCNTPSGSMKLRTCRAKRPGGVRN